MSVVPYEKIVIEDLNLGTGRVDVSMPGGGKAVGTQFGIHAIPAPMSAVHRTTNQSISSGSDTIVQLTTDLFDPYNWYDSATYKFTPVLPYPVLMLVSVQLVFASMTGFSAVKVFQNTSEFVVDAKTSTATGVQYATSALMWIYPNDYVQLKALQTSGGAMNVTYARLMMTAVGRLPVMDHVQRTFELGWMPDADAVNGPPNALLRMDNLILDELGALVVRAGSAKITADLGAGVHSLFTIVRSGSRLRYAGSGSSVFRNGSSIASFSGSGDISFASYLGQTFMARGFSKYKDDGTTVRNWGIAMTGGAPTVAALDSRQQLFATWDSGETGHEFVAGVGTGITYGDDRNDVPNGATVMALDNTTFRAVIQRIFGPSDLSNYVGPVPVVDDDVISLYVFTLSPGLLRVLTMQIDCNNGNFQDDFYTKTWKIGSASATGTGKSRRCWAA